MWDSICFVLRSQFNGQRSARGAEMTGARDKHDCKYLRIQLAAGAIKIILHWDNL